MDRPRRVVLVRAGKAEVGEYPIAKELGDKAVIARHDARTGVLIGADDLAHVLGIEPRRQGGRTDEIAEHDGELAPLRGIWRGGSRDRFMRRERRRSVGPRGGRSFEFLDRGHDFAPVAHNGDAEILEILDR